MDPVNNNFPPRLWGKSNEFNSVKTELLPAKKRFNQTGQEEPSPLEIGRAVVIDLTGDDDDEVQILKTSKRTKHVAGKYNEGSDDEDFKPKGKSKQKSKKIEKKRDRVEVSDEEDFSPQSKKTHQSQGYDKDFALIEKYLKSRSYAKAYEVASKLYNAFEPDHDNRVIILQKFEEILSRGQKAIGKSFYAWLLYVITWHTEQGDLNLRSNKLSNLVNSYKESAELGCDFARLNLANLLSRNQYLDEAIEHYLLYLKESPEPWEAYAALGTFYKLGWNEQHVDLAKAEYYYTQGHLAGCARSTCNLAELKQDKKELSTADRKEVCELYRISGERGFADGWYNLGVLYMDEGWFDKKDFSEAEKCFRKAYELNPTDETNGTAVAEAILKNEQEINLERSLEAIQFFEGAIQLGSHEAAYRRGVLYMKGNRFIEKNEELAIKDFEKLESFNCSEELSFVDGLFLLARLYLRAKSDDPLSLLDKTIAILNNAERLCSEWPNWKKTHLREDIHKARDPILELLIHARRKRVKLLLEKCKKSEQNERNRILCLALYDCKHAADENKGFTPQSLIVEHRYILGELIKLNLQFAKNPESANETKDISPLNKGKKIKKSISFEGVKLEETDSRKESESKNFLKKANKYLEQLKKVNGTTPQFMGSITVQLGAVLVKVAKGEQDIDDRLVLLRQARDLYLKSEDTYILELNEVYKLFYQAYLDAALDCTDEERKRVFHEKAVEYYEKMK